MATANELLARLTGSDERVCVIDLDTRQINIPKTITALGVASDDDVHRLKFRMPKTYTGTDLSDLEIRINYMNAKNEPDVYPVADKTVNDDFIEFSWLVGDHALAYKGNVNFIVCMKKTGTVNGEENVVLKEFNTTVATLPVLEGLEVDVEPIEGELYDLLETLRSQIGEAVQKATEKVVEKRDEVIASIPEDWQTTYNLYRTRANAITKTVEGSVIAVDDASDDYLRGLTLYGKSTQVSTTGKNLFSTNLEYGLWVFSSKTKTINNNYVKSADLVQVTPGKTYCFSGTAITNFQGNLAFYDVNGNYTGDDKQLYGFNTFTVPDDVHYIAFHTQTSFVKNLNGTVQLEEGSDATSYEPYSGGVASPSPEWPQEIETPAPRFLLSGANLLEIGGITTNTNASITQSDDSYTLVVKGGTKAGWTSSKTGLSQHTTRVLRGKQVCIAHDSFVSEQSVGARAGFNIRLSDGTYEYPASVGPSTRSVTITIPDDAEELEFAIYTNNSGEPLTTDNTITIEGLRVSVINQCEWTPYQSTQLVDGLPLPGIPVSAGGNYTDENGQQWVCDEMDFVRGLYIQRIYTETCKLSRDDDSDRYTGTTTRSANLNYVTGSGIPVLCDILPFHPQAANGQPTNGIRISSSGASFIAARYDDVVLSEVTLSYPLATPIIQTFAAKFGADTATALLAAYSALHTNYPNTTIINDQGARIAVKYNVDTQTYLENSYRPTDDQVQEAVKLWLDEHPDAGSGSVTTDKNLQEPGVPADAEAVGDALAEVYNTIGEIEDALDRIIAVQEELLGGTGVTVSE